MSDVQSQLGEWVDRFPTRTQPIPPELKRGWRVIIERPDGALDEVSGFTRVDLVNDSFGRVTLGKSPQGNYDQWAYHEVNGGGSVIVPWCKLTQGPVIGLLEETRLLQHADGVVRNVPRGFCEAGKSYFDAALNELDEEVGMRVLTGRVVLLEGEPCNPNSTFFETWGTRNGGEPEGVRLFAYEFAPQELESVAGDGTHWKIKATLHPRPGIGEKINGCVFVSVAEAVRVGDMFTLAAISRLMVKLT